MEGKLSVVVADDNERIISLLSDLLKTDEDIDVVAGASDRRPAGLRRCLEECKDGRRGRRVAEHSVHRICREAWRGSVLS